MIALEARKRQPGVGAQDRDAGEVGIAHRAALRDRVEDAGDRVIHFLVIRRPAFSDDPFHSTVQGGSHHEPGVQHEGIVELLQTLAVPGSHAVLLIDAAFLAVLVGSDFDQVGVDVVAQVDERALLVGRDPEQLSDLEEVCCQPFQGRALARGLRILSPLPCKGIFERALDDRP